MTHWEERCAKIGHKYRDNAFGVTWCVWCGRLHNKPSGKQIKSDDIRIVRL